MPDLLTRIMPGLRCPCRACNRLSASVSGCLDSCMRQLPRYTLCTFLWGDNEELSL